MNNNTASRIGWIDAAKGLGIIFVVAAHIGSDTVTEWMYSFHIPLFIILSGYVFRAEDDFKTFAGKKFRSIIVPYVCLGLVMALYQIWLDRGTGVLSAESVQAIFAGLCVQNRYWTLWYLACLLGLDLLFFFLIRYVKRELYIFPIVFVLTAAGLLLPRFGVMGLPWNLDAAFAFSLFFYLGYLMKCRGARFSAWLSSGSHRLILMVISLAVNLLCHAANRRLGGHVLNIYCYQYGIIPLSYAAALSGSIFIVALSGFLERSRVLTYIGRYSLLYFAWHQQIVIPLVSGLLGRLGFLAHFDYDSAWQRFSFSLIVLVASILILTGLNELIRKSKLRFMIGLK